MLRRLGWLSSEMELAHIRNWHLLALALEMSTCRSTDAIRVWCNSHHVYPLARARGHQIVFETARRMPSAAPTLNLYLQSALEDL